MSTSNVEWRFTYNADGLRIQREGNNKTYKYVYNGGQLTQMTVDGQKLYFTYDVGGAPMSVTLDGTTYYYVTNLQGDVIAILDGNGNSVVGYVYDAWGNLLSSYDTSGSNLGTLNPLRYRGYVFDEETGLYYLQSRYYNPEWGRFISMDNQMSPGDITGMNLFAYCGNNPVNRIDPTGEAWVHWIIGAAVVVGFGALTVITCGGSLALAATSVGLVANGVAAASTATTIAAGAFIGSATVYGTAVLAAASNSNSLQDFADQGNWGTVVGTVLSGGFGAIDGYSMYRAQSSQYENAYNYSGGKNENYTQKRGWTDQRIRNAIHNGVQGTTVNRAGDPCVVYGYPGISNQYIVINESTRSIVQVSNLYDKDWIVDCRIKWAP